MNRLIMAFYALKGRRFFGQSKNNESTKPIKYECYALHADELKWGDIIEIEMHAGGALTRFRFMHLAALEDHVILNTFNIEKHIPAFIAAEDDHLFLATREIQS